MPDERDPRTRTPGGGFRPLAPASLERASTAGGRQRSETHDQLGQIETKIAVLTTNVGNMADSVTREFETIRLAVANEHAALRASIAATSNAVTAITPKGTSWGAIAAVIISIAFPIGFIIFAAGKYPDKYDFKELAGEVVQKHETLRDKTSTLEIEMTRLRGAVETINKELDRLESVVAAKADKAKKPR